MKRLALLFGISLLALTSCKLNNRSFNKQKFTSLKTIKPPYPVEQEKADEHLLSSLKKPMKVENRDDKMDDYQPVTSQVKQAMDRGDLIVIKIKNQRYILRNPEYDIIYQSLTGELVSADPNSFKNKQRIELRTDDIDEMRNGKKVLYLRDVDDAETILQEDIQEQQQYYEDVKPTKREEPIYRSTSNEQIYHSRKSLKYAPNHPVHKSENIQIARKFRIASTITFLMSLLFLLISLFSFSLLLLILWPLGLIITFFLMIAAVTYYRRYKNECRYAGVQELKNVASYRRMTWVGLIIFSLPLLGLPLILPAVVVALQGKRV